jgi:pyruvate/2-oxoglutarate dehydrogenase complex dihydrolipoamide dehydrogenase (E3) component
MDYDFVVIGGGSAGYAAARTAVNLGLKTAVVEGGKDVGGLCILRGCMPSKTFIESGNRMMILRHAGEFGLSAENIGYDAKAILARKRRIIGEFASYRQKELESGRFPFIRGNAEFLDPHTIRIALLDGEEQTISSRSFLIATGSHQSWPDIDGLSTSGAITSDEVLESNSVPKSIIVLGAGPVALEFAHYYNAMGAEVTIIQRSECLLKEVDHDVSAALREAFEKRGIKIYTATKLRRIETTATGKRAVFEHEGKEVTVEAEQVLNGLGRAPNVEKLSLDTAGVTLNGKTIGISATQQTSVPHIFAAGDCCGPVEVVHIAVEQGEVAAKNAAKVLANQSDFTEMNYRLKLFVVFSDPQIAVVGLSEAEAEEKGITALAAKYPFDDHGKSIILNELAGFVKLVVDAKTREIIGGAVVGPHASDLIHEVVVAMRFHSTAGQLATTPHYHPTLSEIWTYPAEELAG